MFIKYASYYKFLNLTILILSRMTLIKYFFMLFLALLFTNSIKANETILINQNQYFIDVNKSIVLSNMDVSTINSTWSKSKTHILLHELCEFSIPISKIEIGTAYTIYIPSQDSNFILYFTELPIISIDATDTIVDEPNILAYFKLIESNNYFLESHIGIQYRGATSQSWSKKSMEFKFWTDPTGIESEDHTLLGLVNNNSWNLQAIYNEPLRIRSKTNNDLWRMINTLHYQDEEPDAINGVRMKYIELFINKEYRGVYCLGEKVNRKQLKLKKHNGNIRGELYKGVSWGASTFTSVPSYDNNLLLWSGFEYKHPDEEIDWYNLHELVDFVMNSSNQYFFEDYKNRFDSNNLVDYYLFLNLLRATDNTGKNTYIAKYSTNEKYFYVPWDLDGSFGTIWDGTNDNTTDDLLSNGLYKRLIYDCSQNGFKENLKKKWLALRSTILTHDSLMSLFALNNDYLEANSVFEREHLAWPTYTYDSKGLSYISTWITSRLAYLDMKFTGDCNSLSVNENTLNNNLFKIYPIATDDLIYITTEFLDDYKVFVYNSLGQVVLQQLSNPSKKTLSLNSLNKGVYFIKLENNDYYEFHKIIVTK